MGLRDALRMPLNSIPVGKISRVSRFCLGLLTGATLSVLWMTKAIATEAPLEPLNPPSRVDNGLPSAYPVLAQALTTDPLTIDPLTIDQLTDVSPGDWAYEALASLVEQYNCLAGYPDGRFGGTQTLNRYEFAASLAACLSQFVPNAIAPADILLLQQLSNQFADELTAIRHQAETLDARVAALQANQFSTTSQLYGEVVLGLNEIAAGDTIFGEAVPNVAVLSYRNRLSLVTSFSGGDRLQLRLQTTNTESFYDQTGTFEGDLGFVDPNADQDTSNEVQLDALTYTLPLSPTTELYLAAAGGRARDFADTINALDGDGGSGALSRFGMHNPLYYLVEGSGIGLRQQLGDSLELSLGYLSGDGSNPDTDSGLFNGSYGALAQLVYRPSDRFRIGLTYVNAYNRETLTGTPLSNPRSFLQAIANQPVNINVQPSTPSPTPQFFPANQPIPSGQTLPSGTQLPTGTRLNSATVLPVSITIPAQPPGTGTVTLPAGTVLPAGTTLFAPITLPFAVALPVSITLPIDLTIPGSTLPPPRPVAFEGTLGELLSQPNFAGVPLGFDLSIPTRSYAIGLELSWQLSDGLILGGWVGYTLTSILTTGNGLLSQGDLHSATGAMTLAFPDLGGRGNLRGLIVGVEPSVITTDINVRDNLFNPNDLDPTQSAGALALLNVLPDIQQLVDLFESPDPDISLHVEAFYQLWLNDNLSITPGIIWITAPGSLASNNDLWVVTLRTTFRF